MKKIYKFSALIAVVFLALVSCDEKEWQHNEVEKVPVYAISELEVTTSDVPETEAPLDNIDIYYKHDMHIYKIGSFLTMEDIETPKIDYTEVDGLTRIEYRAIGEFYYLYTDPTNGNALADTIVDPFYQYQIDLSNGNGTLAISDEDTVVRSYNLKAKESEEFYPVSSK